MEYELLQSLAVLLGVSIAVVFLLHRLNIPSIAGFIIAGMLIGPHGVGLIKNTHSVELIAEIGVILLLFTLGIEFSISRLMKMRRAVIHGGGLQVLLTAAAAAFMSYFSGMDANHSVFYGFLVALSSTAIVIKMFSDSGDIDTPHGRIMTGILIFQDLCVVPFMLLIPSLSGDVINLTAISIQLLNAVLIITAVLLSARWVVPVILHQVVQTKSRELFIITILFLCIGTALLTSRFGLSLSLGAFLAGLIISESEYAHQATSDILPFKESFMGLFFVSIGMLMNVSFAFNHYIQVAAAFILIFCIKASASAASSLAVGSSLRTSIIAGLGLAQIGEFSFVLAIAGKASGLITEDAYQIFLSASVITMILTPFLLKNAPSFSAWLTSRRLFSKIEKLKRLADSGKASHIKQGHVIIIGFGLNGRNLARVLKETGIPYAVLEINSDTVQKMKRAGEPIYYGDGTSTGMLQRLGVNTAKLLVIAISDPVSTRRIVSISRHENPDLYIIVRTRYLVEVDELKALGADEVIPEEFETSVEIFSRVLNKYHFPGSVIMELSEKIRKDNYAAFRRVNPSRKKIFEKTDLPPEIEFEGYRIPDRSFLIGKSIAELQIRKRTGVTVIAIQRGRDIIPNPDPDFVFMENDIALFTGDRASMSSALEYFKSLR